MRKKRCKFCKENIKVDYKNAELLKKFISDKAKIQPRKMSGVCAKHQRLLSKNIKRARNLSIIPLTI